MQSNRRDIGGFLILAGSALFLLGMIIAEARYPGYSISENMISDLGIGPTALIFNSVTILTGIATVASVFLIRHSFSSRPFILLLHFSGIGILGLGLFPENAGHLHYIFASLAFISGSLAAVYSSGIFLSPFRYISSYLGCFSIVAAILFAVGNYLGLGPGGMERLIVYPIIVWFIGLGGALMKPFRTSDLTT